MELKKHKLGEIAKILNGSTPSTLDPENYDGDIVWATPKDLSDQKSKYFYCGSRNITKKGYANCSTQMIPANNILMSSRAPIGLFAINKVDCCTNQGFKNIILDKTISDVDFMYYFLKYHVKEIEALGSGTTFKEVSKASFEQFEICIPSLSTQRKIASVLSSLDSKITLNRRINTKLETIAKRLYDYWFVQFDFPDANGNPYKSSGGKMVWNDALKREIPEGWEVKSIKEIADTYSGGTPLSTNSSYYENGTIPWINSGEVNEPIIVNTNNFITELGLQNSSAKFYPKNTILVAMYGATAGKVSLLTFEATSNQAICGVISKQNEITYYLFLLLSSLCNHYIKISTGSARNNISQEIVKQTMFCVPNEKTLLKFNNVVTPTFNHIVNLSKETARLTALRDKLLPLLMNGQVEVA